MAAGLPAFPQPIDPVGLIAGGLTQVTQAGNAAGQGLQALTRIDWQRLALRAAEATLGVVLIAVALGAMLRPSGATLATVAKVVK